MDVADAINLMLYASPRTDGQPGCAVWDLFRAEDAPKIRAFLHRKFDRTHAFTDRFTRSSSTSMRVCGRSCGRRRAWSVGGCYSIR